MDKYEYKLRSEEIKSLIKQRDFIKAVEIADTIDWTRVRSVSMLCTISDLYKINRRYKEAKELLLQAYDRHPGGRTILYSLCELCIKTDDIVGALRYYKEFVNLAPTDNGKFILLYKIYVAQGVGLEERVAVLEELKERDPHEKWGYELAYLYHRIGLGTKCVEACDDLIVWFREGKYVKKAMELKMLHQPLTSDQESIYRQMITTKEQIQYDQQTRVFDGTESQEQEIKVKMVDVSEYNTINLQEALGEKVKEVLVADEKFSSLYNESPQEMEVLQSQVVQETFVEDVSMQEVSEPQEEVQEIVEEPIVITAEEVEEPDIEEKLIAGSITEAIMAPMMQDTGHLQELIIEDGNIVVKEPELLVEEVEEEESFSEVEVTKDEHAQVHSRDLSDTAAIRLVEAAKEPISNMIREQVAEAMETVRKEERPSVREVMQSKPAPDFSQVNPPEKMGRLLSQEYDGQIRLVVPEGESVEKQITGQLNLEDILAEWERTKKENEEKRKLKTQQRLLEQTGTMFTEFEEKVRDGILEKLEKSEEVSGITSKEELPSVEELEEIEDVSVEADSDSEDFELETSAISTMEEVENSETEEVVLEETFEESEEQEEEIPLMVMDELKDNFTEKENATIKEESVEEADEESLSTEDDLEEEPSDKYEETVRSMTEEEVTLFAPFIQTKSARVRLMQSLDKISLAAYTGNVFVTGETQQEAVELAKSVVREVQMTDRNFSGKVAKVTGHSLNNRDMNAMVSKLANGALIIEKAAGMEAQTTNDLLKALNQEKTGIVVILQDTKKAMNKMMEYFSGMKEVFNVHIEVEELGDDALVAYGRKYARYQEYSIDEMGILALHTRIDAMQTSDHIVTVADVREIVDEAIAKANRKSFRHFTDVLFAKRYNDDDMIILRERDFLE